MIRINHDSVIDLVFQIHWKSAEAHHTDCYQASRINIWRDILPPVLLDALQSKQVGETVELGFEPGKVLPDFDPRQLHIIGRDQFDRRFQADGIVEPSIGRFYPKGMLKGMTGIFRANVEPFRCVELNNGRMMVDFNHPLAGKELFLSAIVGKVENKKTERGGSSVDWVESLMAGPGMQARWRSNQTDYFSTSSFTRDDERADTVFYTNPRFSQHIDDTAIEMVRNTYGRFLGDGMRVLDLMSSWQSHIPMSLKLKELVGLGLNEKELKKNPQLDDTMVQDLNVNPLLPFETDRFDVVVCTVSVEYLTDPLAIF